MQQITVTIKTGNDAFQPDPYTELARIFEELSKRLKRDAEAWLESEMHEIGYLFDKNGNNVGTIHCS